MKNFVSNNKQQHCIFYTAIQQQFIQSIFKMQMSEYVEENIIVESVSFPDNQDRIDLISVDIFSILNDQCKIPDPNDKRFVAQLYKVCCFVFRLCGYFVGHE